MARVIVNADDMGMTVGVTGGIVRAMLDGIVTSATLMSSLPDATDAASQILAHGLDAGVHLNLTQGRPLLAANRVPSLTDPTGQFWPAAEFRVRARRGALATSELEAEFARQIEHTFELGITPSHLDTHHHVHGSVTVARAMHRVARRYGIRRVRTLRTLGSFSRLRFAALEALDQARRARRPALDNDKVARALESPIALLKPGETVQDWIDMFEALAECSDSSVFEVICHPAEPDEGLRRASQFVESRAAELSVVTSPNLRRAVSDLGVKLISYRDM